MKYEDRDTSVNSALIALVFLAFLYVMGSALNQIKAPYHPHVQPTSITTVADHPKQLAGCVGFWNCVNAAMDGINHVENWLIDQFSAPWSSPKACSDNWNCH